MRTHDSAQYWIEKLSLRPHPEGGFYRETYRSPLTIAKRSLSTGFAGDRSASTAIYFLLEGRDFSALHRLCADEMWHFYAGDPLFVHAIDPAGMAMEIKLGSDPDAGETFQAVVTAGCWFGSCLKEEDSFSLVGCTVAPGFDFADFELGDRTELVSNFPKHRELIERLTRG